MERGRDRVEAEAVPAGFSVGEMRWAGRTGEVRGRILRSWVAARVRLLKNRLFGEWF